MMKIQINTDNNVSGNDNFTIPFTEMISKQLDRFGHQITRIEVHFSDEDGNKKGQSDKRCMMEARLEGMNPIAVTNLAATSENALSGAIDKIKTSLETNLGRLGRN